MAPESSWLDEAALAIADGRPIDWKSLESTVGQADRRRLTQLRLVAGIADVQRSEQGRETIEPTRGEDHAKDGARADTWGPLELIERIGGGAYGDVFRARDPRLERDVALKLVNHEGSGGSAAGVIEEARLLARVRHPHVVAIYGADARDGRVGIWMELVSGRSLDREVADRGPFGAAEAAVVGIDLCGALAAVHAAGVVHRDVKAGNVMRELGGRIVLMDFGAGYAPPDPVQPGQPGTAGTPLYMAPELLAGQPATPVSDLYSLGVLLFHLVTGSYPVSGKTIDELRASHRRDDRPRLREMRPDLPPDLVGVIERALATEPDRRFGSAGAMGTALSHALVERLGTPNAGDTVRADGIAPPGAARSLPNRASRAARWGWLAVAALVAVLAAAGTLALRTRPPAAGAKADAVFQARDWLLVAAFDNATGDARLDGTVEYALEQELGHSRFVSIASRERVADALRLMRRPLQTRLDDAVGREVCLRDGGIRVMVTGRIDRLGGQFQIGGRLIEPSTGRTLLAASVAAPTENSILTAVRDLAAQIRSGLGEELASGQDGGQTLEKATTRSLRALQSYSRAMALLVPGETEGWRAARALLEQATQEDPEFASAYAYLSWTWQSGLPWADRSKQLAASERAFQLTEHATERERFFVRGTYYQQRDRIDEARAEYEALATLYPDHYWAVNNLAAIHGSTDAALPYVLRRADLRPKDLSFQTRAARELIAAGRKTDAFGYAERAREIQRQFRVQSLPAALGVALDKWVDCFPIWQRWVDGDVEGSMAALRSLSAQAARDRDADLQRALAVWYIILGRLREADALLMRSLAELEASGEHKPASRMLPDVMPEILLAWNAELRGDRAAARAWMQRLSDRVDWSHRREWWESVIMPARAGMSAEVDRSLAEADRPSYAADEYVAWAKGDVALAGGRPAEAAALLTRALTGFPPQYITRHLLVQSASRALEAGGRTQEALDVIVNNLQPIDRSPYQYLNLSAWLDLQARRAQLLRRLGRTREAWPIETELRSYLRHADSDLQMVQQLRR